MPQLKRHLGYPKFSSPPYRFLILRYDYFLQQQLITELRRQGHEVFEQELPKRISSDQALRLILNKMVASKPDALIAINNMGLDMQGIILDVLGELSVPVIIWYLDNYRFSGPYLSKPAPESTVVFSSDKALRKTLEEAEQIKNIEIAKYLELPPIKIHCSVLAEDAIKEAIKDYKSKTEK